jgi:hypothetical protein
MLGTGQVQKPHKGCLGRDALRCIPGEARWRPIDTLKCGLVWRVITKAGQAHERRSGEVRVKAFAGSP